MYKSYFNIALRSFLKYKVYSAINVLGLAVGLASCLLISLFVMREISYDQWLSNSENVYRYESTYITPEGDSILAKSPLRAGRDLKQFFGEIEAVSRVIDAEVLMSVGIDRSLETVWFVDGDFFKVLDLPMLSGNKSAALRDGNSILLSQSMSEKYFSNGSVMGEIITFDGQRDYKVVGVFEDIPDNSQFNFEFIVKYNEADKLYNFGYNENWDSLEGYTYAALSQGTDVAQINQRFADFTAKYYPPDHFGAGTKVDQSVKPALVPMQDVHLLQGRTGNIKPPGSIMMVYTFSTIAVLILVLACINFLNLTTNRSFQRAREATIRKVVGASKTQLVAQFLIESMIIALLSMLIAIVTVQFVMPWYQSFMGQNINSNFLQDPKLMASLIGLALVVGIAGGLYPAFRLSTYKPSQILRSNQSSVEGGNSWSRSLLVTFQFVISTSLIILTLVVIAQRAYVDSKDVGFSKENKVVLRNLQQIDVQQKALFGDEVAKLNGVNKVTFSTATPSDRIGFSRGFKVMGHSDSRDIELAVKSIGYDFFDTYGVKMLHGRDFSVSFPKDEFVWGQGKDGSRARSSGILNLKGAAALGFSAPQQALGKVVTFDGYEFEVVGVVGDFNFRSLRSELSPSVYILAKQDHITMTVLYNANSMVGNMLNELNKTWRELFPDIPFTYEFVDENIQAQYETEVKAATLLSVFSLIAIIIAFLGLYALTSYSIQRRTKEIGVRKVHGATTKDIIVMLVKQFSMPLVVANVFAWPLAYYFSQMYLDTFYYRIDMGLSYFLIASISALIVAAITICGYSYRFAKAKPNVALRYE